MTRRLRWLRRPDGAAVPSAERAILRVPEDTPAEDWKRTLEVVRAARRPLEAEPTIPPPAPPRRPR